MPAGTDKKGFTSETAGKEETQADPFPLGEKN